MAADQQTVRPITSRDHQRSAGATRFFTGRPCINGHMSERFVSNGVCVECRRERKKDYRKTDTGKAARARHARNWRARQASLRRLIVLASGGQVSYGNLSPAALRRLADIIERRGGMDDMHPDEAARLASQAARAAARELTAS